MAGWQRIAAFVAVAVVVFAAAIGVGRAVGPIEGDEGDEGTADHGHDDRVVLTPADADGGESGSAGPTLDLEQDVYDAGPIDLAFTVRDAQGEPVTSYERKHEKLLHLVLVRRDLGGYRHVHPTLDETTGQWSVPVELDAGSWRVYADFTPTGGAASLAEADVSVGGDFTPIELSADNDTARVGGFEVHLARDGDALTLHVQRDGKEVTDLEPYLGAYGHLVAIRADDLTYLHVHPQDGPAGPEVAFHAGLDEAGRYRLFFEFQHGGVVHRAEFTLTVDGADGPDESGATDDHGEHGTGEHGTGEHGTGEDDESKEESGGHDH